MQSTGYINLPKFSDTKKMQSHFLISLFDELQRGRNSIFTLSEIIQTNQLTI